MCEDGDNQRTIEYEIGTMEGGEVVTFTICKTACEVSRFFAQTQRRL